MNNQSSRTEGYPLIADFEDRTIPLSNAPAPQDLSAEPSEAASGGIPLATDSENDAKPLNGPGDGATSVKSKKKVIAPVPQPITNQQTVGNIGLFYVCYRLSLLGWNVMPTARNARGIDIVIYSQDGRRTLTIQVKTLSRGSPVPLGNKMDHLFANYVVICRHVSRASHECFVLTPEEIQRLVHKGEKNGKISYWLQPRQYAVGEFREQWDRIGRGE